jgi:PAS domain S-box-containing protein
MAGLSGVLHSLRRFLTAEEVPRWFGLSLVLIYLVGLGTVARLGVTLARQDGSKYFEQSSNYCVRRLAARLDAAAASSNPSTALNELHRAVRDFAAAIPAKSVRVVDQGEIVASIQPGEVGSAVQDPWKGAPPGELEQARPNEATGAPDGRVVRVTLQAVPSIPAADGQPSAGDSAAVDPATGRYLEVILPLQPVEVTNLAGQAATLAVILVVLGALFVVYRCLREQLRGVWQIADRLETHGHRIEEDLASLRISDTLDSVTASWNELVDLTQRLMASVQRNEANQELSRALEKSSGGAVADAMNALPDGIFYLADDLRFEYVNAAAQRLMGWSTDEAKRFTLPEAQASGIGRQVLDLLRESRQDDGYFQPRTEVLTAKDAEGQEQSSYRLVIIPIQRSRRQGHCVAVVRDVSQQLRAERAREEFVAQVTHELRTPLTNIRAYTETLSSGMFEDPKVIAECYNVITKETRRLSRLIEDILSVSQLEVGSIELRVDSVDLKALLTESLRDVRGIAEEKNIDVQLVLPAKLEPTRGDRDKLAVVINNLLGNAIKYTPKDGNVIVGCQVNADSVVLTFKDNGYGIDPKDHARIFEKYQRGTEPEVQQERGTGIGLYTAREIVRRHGGDIELISARQKGSTFMVKLPRQKTRSSSLSVTQGDADGANSDRG